jgi:anti-anti-sigma factor
MMPRQVDAKEYLEVTVAEGNPAIVHLAGEVDLSTVPLLTQALARHHGDVELRCARVTFFGVAGVNAFMAAHKAFVERGAKLVVVDPSRAVLRVLVLLNLEGALNIRNNGSRP